MPRRVLPYDPVADAVVLIEQFRLPALAAGLDPVLVELPAGLCDDGETPETTARRETQEEMGLTVGALRADRRFPADPRRLRRSVRRSTPAACRRRRPAPTASPATPAWRSSTRTSACASGRRTRAIEAALGGRLPNSVTLIGLLWLRRAAAGAAQGVDGGMTESCFSMTRACGSPAAPCVASGPDGIVLDRTVFYARSRRPAGRCRRAALGRRRDARSPTR